MKPCASYKELMHTMGCDMHWVYRLYAFMCSAHLAFCVLELSLGYAPAAPTLSLKEDTCAPNNTTLLLLHPAPLPLSGLYFLACMASTAFSMVYLMLLEEDGADQHQHMGLLADILFWFFLLTQALVSLGTLTLQPLPVEHLLLRWTLHCGALYLCLTGSQQPIAPITASVGFLIFLALSCVDATLGCGSQAVLVLCCVQRFLDLMLVLCHRWDAQPPEELLLNSRLFFIALSGALLHINIPVLLPP